MPDDSDLPEGQEAFKLSWTALRANYGDGIIDQITRIWAKRGGIHPDIAAGMLGFSSGEELIRAVQTVEHPRRKIERLTDERMQEYMAREAPIPQESIQAEAMAAVHNEKRGQLLMREMELLMKMRPGVVRGLVRKVSRRIPPIESVRKDAENIIRGKRVRDIRPAAYAQAETKAARAAVDA